MNYWRMLAQARADLAAARFREAEAGYARAEAARSAAPRRVFFQETLPDNTRRFWDRLRRRSDDSARRVGRWERAIRDFAADFRARSETLLFAVERQLAGGAPAGAQALQPGAVAVRLAAALYLSVGSRLNERRLAVSPILAALFDLLPESGHLGDHDLVTPELAVEPALRLRLVEQALSGLAHLPATEQAGWAGALLAMLDDRSARWTPGTDAARRWLAARLADRYRDEAGEVVRLWQACDEPEQPEANRRWSRLRRLEILAGRDPRPLLLPSHAEAHRLAALLAPAANADEERRCAEAMAVITYRRPIAEPSQAWITASATDDGAVAAVYWWGDEPRDVAHWRPESGPQPIREFLATAGGRVLWSDARLPDAVVAAWPEFARGRPLAPYLETFLEPWLPVEGWSAPLRRRLALARSGGWRKGWRVDRGHPLLVPPGEGGRLAPEQAQLEAALETGLLWLAVRHRIDAADPALRAGLGELARRGDPAAVFLHALAVLGAPDQAAIDAAFAAWTLPLLWTRPDPQTFWRPAPAASAQLQDLAGQDVAVVVTGQPGLAVAGWDPGPSRWRVVMDRLDRLGDFAVQAREAYGPVTLVPPLGQVHDLRAALNLLDDLAAAAAGAPEPAQMLAICHWVRLVETHNGDLLDFQQLRPRPAGACPWYEHYAQRVVSLPRQPVTADHPSAGDTWAGQYVQRARRSGLLAGLVDDLSERSGELDAVWGVFDGSDARWVFHDTAAAHWRLATRSTTAPDELHRLLASRGGRHLSLLSGRGVFAADLERWFDEVLAAYGRPYYIDLPDARPPRLRLAGSGPLPGASPARGVFWAAALTHLMARGGGTLVRAGERGVGAEFWRAAAAGGFGPVAWRTNSTAGSETTEATETTETTETLVVVSWSALAAEAAEPAPLVDTADVWRRTDALRRQRLSRWRRQVALECGALLAEPVGTIEVLDGRWWRLLSPVPGDAPAATERDAPIEKFDLPPANDSTVGRKLAAAVTAWLAEQGVVGGLLPGWEGPPLAAAVPLAPAGIWVHRAPANALWRDHAADILRAWELGQPLPRLLVVGERPPTGAAVVAAACAADGATVLTDDQESYGGLVWARPDALVAALAAGRVPSCDRALVLDLQDHLPPAPTETDGARLLGWLTSGAVPRVDLVGGPLAPVWADFFATRLATPLAGTAEAGAWPMLRRGEAPSPARACPQCDAKAPGAVDGLVCSRCSYHLAGPGPRPEPAPLPPERFRALLQQADRGRDEPLEIWAEPQELAALQADAERAGAQTEPAQPDLLRLPDGRRWWLRSSAGASRTAEYPAILLRPPSDPTLLVPWAPARSDAALTMLYDRFDIAPPITGPLADSIARLLALLTVPAGRDGALPSWAPAAVHAPGATVPIWRLAWLAGVSPGAVKRSLDLLQWTVNLSGDCKAASVEPRHGALPVQFVIPGVPRACEQLLGGLSERLRDVLARWLDGGLAGAWQIADAPADPLDPEDAALDTLLALLAAAPPVGTTRWLYQAPAGAWFSVRRRIGWLGDRELLAAHCKQQIAAWADQLRWALAESPGSEHDGFWRVSLPPARLPQPLLVLGQELGGWIRRAPGDQSCVSWEMLQQVRAALPTEQAPAAVLLANLAQAADRWRDRLASTPPGGRVVGRPVAKQPATGSDRPEQPRRGGDVLAAPLQAEVAAWLAQPAPARLILSGPFGTGRTGSVVAGLAARPCGRDAVFWCADQATAVTLHLAARRLDPTWQPDVRVAAAVPPSTPWLSLAAGDCRVTVMLELQRFGRDIAYRLQEQARAGHLLLTVDNSDTDAGGHSEDLYLTTARRDEGRRLQVQYAQARQLWRVTRPFLPEDLAEARGRRRIRGLVMSRPARSLDECAAAISAATAAGRLGRLVHVVAPLPEDVELLARALADLGWAAVRRRDLEPLLLPGVMESVAAMADAHRLRQGCWPGAGTAPAGLAGWLLADFLPPASAADWGQWLRSLPDEALASAAEFWTRLRRSPWGPVCAAGEEARRWLAPRLDAATAPVDLLPPAVWQTWRAYLAEIFGRTDLASDLPAAYLGSAAEAGGEPAESLAYVCFGSEPASVHRRILSRATDRLLVLYQEHSPLPDEWEV